MARYVRVSTLSFAGVGGSPEGIVERNRAAALDLVERAALDEPDIVCLPEMFPALGLSSQDWFKTAEPVPGPTTEAAGALARKHSMYVVCPLVERRSEKIYNSAVLIDRAGRPMGSYHKMYPTIGEVEAGVTPGTETKVFETDFGRVGFAVCFDLNFRDVVEGLASGGAEIVFFPSMYRGGLQLCIWAYDFSFYMVSAITGVGSAIVDPLGRVLTETSIHHQVASKTLNLDCRVLHIDYNDAKWEAIKRKYGAGVEMEVAAPEAVFLLASHMPSTSVNDVIKEFELETRDAYFRRASSIREKALRQSGDG